MKSNKIVAGATSGKMFGAKPVQTKVGVKYQPSPKAANISGGFIKPQLKAAVLGSALKSIRGS